MICVRVEVERSLRNVMEHKDKYKIIPSVYAFFIKDGKILLSRRCNTGFEDGKYALPSGHAEEKETMREALCREVREEVGVKLQNKNINFSHIMHRSCGDHERIDFFFHVLNWDEEPRNMEPDKCDDLVWFPLEDLPNNMVEYVKVAIQYHLKGIAYSEFGWN